MGMTASIKSEKHNTTAILGSRDFAYDRGPRCKNLKKHQFSAKMEAGIGMR